MMGIVKIKLHVQRPDHEEKPSRAVTVATIYCGFDEAQERFDEFKAANAHLPVKGVFEASHHLT